MKRVLPVIFACIGLVMFAVFQAQIAPDDAKVFHLTAAAPVTVEFLTQ